MAEQKEIANKLRTLEEKASKARDREANARLFTETLQKYTEAEELTREMVLDLIDKIVVHEANGMQGSKRVQDVEIYFRFIGRLPEKALLSMVP